MGVPRTWIWKRSAPQQLKKNRFCRDWKMLTNVDVNLYFSQFTFAGPGSAEAMSKSSSLSESVMVSLLSTLSFSIGADFMNVINKITRRKIFIFEQNCWSLSFSVWQSARYSTVRWFTLFETMRQLSVIPVFFCLSLSMKRSEVWRTFPLVVTFKVDYLLFVTWRDNCMLLIITWAGWQPGEHQWPTEATSRDGPFLMVGAVAGSDVISCSLLICHVFLFWGLLLGGWKFHSVLVQ